MARTVRSSTLDTREARRRLSGRKKPYYVLLDQGQHLGYYKGARGGTWSARCFIGNGQYKEGRIGIADDKADADGVAVHSFSQAQKAARQWCSDQIRIREGLEPVADGPCTVRDASTDYLSWYGQGGGKYGGKAKGATENAIDVHILPELGDIEVSKLTKKKIREWHRSLATTPPRVRTRMGESQQYREFDEDDPEAIRRRRSTANRVLSVLKAALNHAVEEDKTLGDAGWSSVKPFRQVDAPKIRYLSDDECRRLVNACPSGLRQIVVAALLTGARYGELIGLRCNDFEQDSGMLRIARSKSGKPRDIALTDEGRRFFETAVVGKLGSALVLTRADSTGWKRAQQTRPIKDACKAASIDPPASFHILRHTYASRLARKNVPMKVIADQLGHSDTRMVEKHYAHLSENYVSNTVRAAFTDMGIVEDGNVVSMG